MTKYKIQIYSLEECANIFPFPNNFIFIDQIENFTSLVRIINNNRNGLTIYKTLNQLNPQPRL
jgi:hypothetical protein